MYAKSEEEEEVGDGEGERRPGWLGTYTHDKHSTEERLFCRR